MYKVKITRKTEKYINKLSKKDQERVLSGLEKLEEDPHIGKKLVGDLNGYYSLRVWPFRIVYRIKRKQLLVFVLKVGHRKDVYK